MNDLKYFPIEEIYANDLISIWSDEDVIRYTNIKHPCTLDEIRERIAVLKPFDVFVVSYMDNIVGVIGCPCINKSKAQYGVFYQFKKSVWGKGFATLSMEWLLKYMNEKYWGFTLYADVVVNNIASEKILKHFGFNCISQDENGFLLNKTKMCIRNYRL